MVQCHEKKLLIWHVLPPDSMYSQWFLYSTAITTIHTGSPGHKLAILAIQASAFYILYIHQINWKIICPPWLLRMLLLWLRRCVSRIQASCRIETQRLYPLRRFLDQVMSKTRLRTAGDSRILPLQINTNHTESYHLSLIMPKVDAHEAM